MNRQVSERHSGARILVASSSVVLALCLALPAFAQQRDNVASRAVEIWSDGTRLAGNLFWPKDSKEGEKLPAIVLCHGWGGTKAHLNPQIAPGFSAGGFVVLTFDYRGWGESDSRLVVGGEMPEPDKDGNVTVSARAVKQLVDPFDQQEDIDAAISFILGEPLVDVDRIGIWGSSFGGGHVVWRAAHDDRVKCVVAQVGAMDARSILTNSIETVLASKTKRARGEIEAVPQGGGYEERLAFWVPVDHTDKINVPVLIIDASEEHYFDITKNGGAVYNKLKSRGVETEYHVLEGMAHYGVYSGEGLEAVMKLEVPWFTKHLKGTVDAGKP